ncbi:uncharacterized protein LOC132793488 [Drosophila nasuta]|uniref:uncharacterized protein LOC132793488 n=1 Tax=Drosophila nasuta TaxID=42062 RepID=UPI00295E9B1B|nr:uncharacterized protein LOC132793488 [Drosophila nasuta]XP_060659416.1 uncharacterized protein LOC132793488 [Drosophila nasuta]XP_060659418.1 uncharacterized protein LOC132793488 [Drosophila nasuta]XP_060659419.1 uncharacterized protein LOC132793488 [Drosophila nasuta]XP_060659420.1 uncharacterized protein LOC132793488 [Drosophila nasuta]
MQYLNYALQTSTRLLTSQSNSNSHSNNHSQSQTAAKAAAAGRQQQQQQQQQKEIEEEQIAHACCSRGAQLLRLRHQELAKRRALELEDQLNANAISCAQDNDDDEDSEASSATEEGAVGGHLEAESGATERRHIQKSSESAPQPVQ